MKTLLIRVAAFLGGIAVAWAGWSGDALSADFHVVSAKGVVAPQGLERGDGINHGAQVELALGGLLVLRETGGCRQDLVLAGPRRETLAASAYTGCKPPTALAPVQDRITAGESLSERVLLTADGKADDPGSVSLAGMDDPCLLLPRLSEEAGLNTRHCPSGYLVTGIQCSGSYCDDKRLRCCPYLGGRSDGTERDEPQHWFSEETGQGRRNSYVSERGFVSGLSCRGSYCDDLRPRAVRSDRLRNAGSCGWTSWFSEEGSARGTCPAGAFVSGLQCRGSYCDDLSLLCCRAQTP